MKKKVNNQPHKVTLDEGIVRKTNDIDNTIKNNAIQKNISTSKFLNILNVEQLIVVANNTPPKRDLFGSFIRTGQNTLFFSRTNYGKSILAMQIAFSVSTGKTVGNESPFRTYTKSKKVLYYDAELNPQTFQERYEEALSQLDDNFVYVNEKSTGKILTGTELIKEIEKIAIQHNVEVIILDNLSKILPDSVSAEKSTEIINLLKRTRENTKADFLVIGHTTKGNDKLAIQPSDYYGSAMIQNFFEEIFYLDEVHELDNKLFLRHSKYKGSHPHSKHVPIFTRGIVKGYGLCFNYEGMYPYYEVQKPDYITKVKRKHPIADFKNEILILINSGISQSKIGKFADCSRNHINRIIKSED